MNALTRAQVLVEDKLFATLDPTSRRLDLPGGQTVLLTDTVGFINKLPHQLIDAFTGTLEEVRTADILLHVIDASHPRWMEQKAVVEQVLQDIGVAHIPTFPVCNKLDQLPAEPTQDAWWPRLGAARAVASNGHPGGETRFGISALRGAGIAALLSAIERHLEREREVLRLELPLGAGQILDFLHRSGRVCRTNVYGDKRPGHRPGVGQGGRTTPQEADRSWSGQTEAERVNTSSSYSIDLRHPRILPNLITSLRVLAIPILLFFLARERYAAALSTFVFAGMTDWLDGRVARYVGSDSEEFGKRFDALADKALVGSVLVTLTVMGCVPVWLTGLVVVRDVMLVGGFGILFLWTGRTIRTMPSQFGKWGTFLLLVTVSMALIELLSPNWLPVLLAQTVWGLAGGAIAVSGVQYVWRTVAWLQGRERD